MIIAKPHHGVVAEEAPHFIGERVIEVDRVSPRRLIAISMIGAVTLKEISARPKMVVNNVEYNAKARGVTRVNQALQAIRPAVGMMGRPQVDAVVAPSALAFKLCHRH